MSITASLIVKNELGRYLEPCVAHLRDFCEQIVIVDDGSTDGTAEWIESQIDGQLFGSFIQQEDGFFAGHEGRRRQWLLDKTLECYPTYVLAIDADEFVSDGAALAALCEAPFPVASLSMVEIWKATAEKMMQRMDGGWRAHGVPCLWNVPQMSRHRRRPLRIPNRELACGREPEMVRRYAGRAKPTGVDILHLGWTNEAGRQARFDRYVTADGGKFHAGSHLDSIMWPDTKVSLSSYPWPPALEPYKAAILERTT